MHPDGSNGILRFAFRTVLVPTLLFLTATGCAPSVARRDAADRHHPLFQRAMAERNRGNIDGAVRLFEQIVLEHPTVALAHLELALLLHDRRQDYIAAIYHYQAYVRWRTGTEKDAMIQGRIRDAERMLTARMARTADPNTTGRETEKDDEIRHLRQQLTQSEAMRNRFQDQARTQADQISEMERENQRLRERVNFLLQAPNPRPPTRPRIGEFRSLSESSPHMRTYEVKPGDTLTGIAALVYNDAAQWTRIRDANREIVGPNGAVKPGETLVIPTP